MSFYREQLESYLKKLDVNFNSLADVGGDQKNLKGRTKSWSVKEYVVLDKHNFDLEKEQVVTKKYDGVFCLEVFEYIIDPICAMKNLANLLEVKGRLVVTFPFVYPLHNEVEFDSLRYTISGIKRLAEKANLSIVKTTERLAKNNNLVKYYQEDGMKCAKGHPHNITGYIMEFTK